MKTGTTYTVIDIIETFEKNLRQAIKKQESFLPFYVKVFSDVYREYNNYVDQMFRMMKLGKQTFGIQPNESLEKPHNEYVRSFFELYQDVIDTSKEFLKKYSQLRVSFLKSHNIYLKKTIDIYEQIHN